MSETILIGRSLDASGEPIEGTGVVLNRQSPTAQLLLARNVVVISNPVTNEYGAKIQVENEKGEFVEKGLGIVPPNSIGPPVHIHPTYDETFTVVEGSFEFILNKKPVIISKGEKVVVKRGMAHTFKPADESKICSFLLEANPEGKLNDVIRTIWGLAHDGKSNSKGQPNEFWQGIAIGSELKDDTLFVSPPPFVQRFMFKIFGRTASKKGYKGIYDKYTDDHFWNERVEQIRNN